MSDSEFTCPQNREEVINTYFMEHRAKLIDVAAYLDRLDRARPVGRILDLLSDHTTETPQSAEGMKGALGAPPVTAMEGGAA